MKFFTKPLFLLLLTSSFLSCSDDEEESSYAPFISFVSISPETVGELVDPIEIKITYFDEDGDLGENDAAVKNLFVVDSRNDVKYEFRVQQLAPSGSSIAIEGTLTISIDPLVITDGSTSESVSFSVYCSDRAGNQSNTITTTAITINQ